MTVSNVSNDKSRSSSNMDLLTCVDQKGEFVLSTRGRKVRERHMRAELLWVIQ